MVVVAAAAAAADAAAAATAVPPAPVSPAGLHHFDATFRPVPLSQTFIGVTSTKLAEKAEAMTILAYEKAIGALRAGKQESVCLSVCLSVCCCCC